MKYEESQEGTPRWWLAVNYAFIYIPVALFLVTWVKAYIALPVLALLAYALICDVLRGSRGFALTWKLAVAGAVAFALLVCWCAAAGLGAHAVQPGDWSKHNLLLAALVDRDWPAMVMHDGNEGTIAYYVGAYLVPAAFGKLFGFGVAEQMLMWQAAIGLLIGCCNVYLIVGGGHPRRIIAICVLLALSATFITPLMGLYRELCASDVGDVPAYMNVHWMSKSVKVQYSSASVLLRWVFPQFVTPFVAVSLLMARKARVRSWGLACAPIALYSTFAFVGASAIAVMQLANAIVSGGEQRRMALRDIICVANLAALALAIVLIIYVAGTVLQDKPATAQMGLERIYYREHVPLFVLFNLSWMLWIALLFRSEKDNQLMWSASAVLFVLPFFTMGSANDLCMRASIPALLVVYILVIKNIVGLFNSSRSYSMLLACCLVFCGVSNIAELCWAVSNAGTIDENRDARYASLDEFFDEHDHHEYQYVDWDGSVSGIVLRDGN